MQAQNDGGKESMHILEKLAQEIAEMSEHERSETLEWIVGLEAERKGNRFWLMIAKYLLVKPETVSSVFELTKKEFNPRPNTRSNIRYVDFGKNFSGDRPTCGYSGVSDSNPFPPNFII